MAPNHSTNAFEFQKSRARQASKIFKRPWLHIAPLLHALPTPSIEPVWGGGLASKEERIQCGTTAPRMGFFEQRLKQELLQLLCSLLCSFNPTLWHLFGSKVLAIHAKVHSDL